MGQEDDPEHDARGGDSDVPQFSLIEALVRIQQFHFNDKRYIKYHVPKKSLAVPDRIQQFN